MSKRRIADDALKTVFKHAVPIIAKRTADYFTKSNKSTMDTRGEVTSQHDTSTLYKKKPKSKGRKAQRAQRKRVNFKLKVEKALKPQQPTNVYHNFSTTISLATAPAGGQIGIQYISPTNIRLGTWLGMAATTTTDLGDLLDGVRNPGTTGAPDPAEGGNTSITVKHCQWSMSLKNVSADSLNFDVYQFVAAQDIADANYRDPQNAWVTCLGDSEVAGLKVKLTPATYGCTPLDSPGFGRWWKLLNKQRVFLPSTAKTVIELNNAPRGVCTQGSLSGKYAVKGRTQYIMVVAWGMNDVVVAGGNVFSYLVDKTYHYTVPGDGINGINRPYTEQRVF